VWQQLVLRRFVPTELEKLARGARSARRRLVQVGAAVGRNR
jgi:hypothetical protein